MEEKYLYIIVLIIVLIYSVYKTLNSRKKNKYLVSILIVISCIYYLYNNNFDYTKVNGNVIDKVYLKEFNINDIPKYDGKKYVVINDNTPFFKEDMYKTSSYEEYSDLDDLGRAGTAISIIGKDIMPKEKRKSISNVRPTGFKNKKYSFIDGEYLYNRCHLIAYELTGENDNKNNLVTCTRSLNIKGMLPFENMIHDYILETNNHVLYRVTPIFENDNLVMSGVLMEGYSIEDNGKGIKFNIYAYNNEDNVIIDYKTGNSRVDKDNKNE